MSNMEKAYNPSEHEARIYELWEKSGAFQPSHENAHAKPFSISMPPPNATGQLHLGHSIMLAIQDAAVRYARMNGRPTLWVPGTDHAALPSNNLMEQRLAKEGKTKYDVGRDAFVKGIEEFIDQSRDTIRSQVRSMGASCDWSRERYTLDPALHRCVNETFTKMYENGLIYRGHRIVNWDPNLETTVSDDEIERKTEQTTFYTFQYGPFQIGTSRPETKFGDKYVVMHPDDKRYAKYKHGETFKTEWINGPITATIIKDRAVEPNFGTGVMTITPWHDSIDFEIAQRHNLDMEQIIDFDGSLLPIAGEFEDMHISEARPKIVAKLKAKGLLVAEDHKYVHNIATNSRGGGIIEPQIKLQWFVDVNKKAVNWKAKKHSLKEVMQSVIRDGDIKILPKRFEKTYFHWIDNLRDWCISRQIWFGHRIPVWYRGDEIHVGITPPSDISDWEQDPDTLDTWFSSALWTWSTLIDPKLAVDPNIDFKKLLANSPDFQHFHPTQLMETGYDILFFWVARMILATTYMVGEIPFETVYLHGLVRTRDGKKMSKSHPETVIDPLEIIPKYGADALRLAMIIGLSPGNDSRLYEEKIEGYRNFNNKLWNVARFILDKVPEGYESSTPKPTSLSDKWILERFASDIKSISKDLDSYRFSDAGEKVYSLLWNDLADWYIESSKVEPNLSVLVYCLETILKLAHPFAPFVTEVIWQKMAWQKQNLIVSAWPKAGEHYRHETGQFDQIKALVSQIRRISSDLSLNKPSLGHSNSELVDANADLIIRLSNLSEIQIGQGSGLKLNVPDLDAWLNVDANILENYKSKLKQQREAAGEYAKKLTTQLKNPGYLKSAPAHLVSETREKLAEADKLIKQLDEQLDSIG